MKKITTIILFLFSVCIWKCSLAQSLSPKVFSSCGGYYVSGGNSLSFTMGETFYKSFQNGNLLLTQGFQQSYVTLIVLNLKTFLEGYYTSGGQMTPVLHNRNPLFPADACDSNQD